MIIDNLKSIAKEYKQELYKIEKGDEYCIANGEENYINKSYIGNKIELGIYDDEELMIASFFHELGHVIDKTEWWIDADETTTYKAEKMAWELGFELSKKYGYEFSEKTYQWCNEQLKTYKI